MKLAFAVGICLAAILVAGPALAETKVTISKTHLCCGACVSAVGKTLAEVKGVKHETSQADSTIKLTADSDEAAQKAVDALAAAGFHGKLDNDKIKFKAVDAPKGKVARLELTGVHNCCGMCTRKIKETLAKVSGVKADTAKARETSFVVEGDFVAAEVVEALLGVGFHASVKN